MAKFRVLVAPTGCLNGSYWPEAGETVELPEAVGAGMVEAGALEAVKESAPKVEKRPTPKAGVETRKKD